jgi:hypothetical protein
MEPPICSLCDVEFAEVWDHEDSARTGGLVWFRKQEGQAELEGVGHPENARWFCAKHYAEAESRRQLTAYEARKQLVGIFGGDYVPPTSEVDEDGRELVIGHSINRSRALLLGLLIGIAFGGVSLVLSEVGMVDLALRWELLGWLALALVTVTVLHEGVHGLFGVLFGHRPSFGFEPPLVFCTFQTKIKRGQFIAIALAPLIVLDTAFVLLFCFDVARVYSLIAIAANTIGAVGDVWLSLQLSGHERDSWVLDTRTGLEVWRNPR